MKISYFEESFRPNIIMNYSNLNNKTTSKEIEVVLFTCHLSQELEASQ